MKKILLLILTSLVLFVGCQKEDPQQEENGKYPTMEVHCKCGASYYVICKIGSQASCAPWGFEWVLYDKKSSPHWEVKNAAGEYVSFYEYSTSNRIKFSCEECGADMGQFHSDDFKKLPPSLK